MRVCVCVCIFAHLRFRQRRLTQLARGKHLRDRLPIGKVRPGGRREGQQERRHVLSSAPVSFAVRCGGPCVCVLDLDFIQAGGGGAMSNGVTMIHKRTNVCTVIDLTNGLWCPPVEHPNPRRPTHGFSQEKWSFDGMRS